jgi:hypothetical protein
MRASMSTILTLMALGLGACTLELVPWDSPADLPKDTDTPNDDTAAASADLDGDGYSEAEGDCDDTDPWVHPEAADFWYDGVDGDCDGANDFDQDADGYEAIGYGGDDCVDTNPDIHPGETEVIDGIDQDCDDTLDEETSIFDDDGDGFSEDDGDCDDTDASICPGCPEVNDDGIDQDCDGGDTISPDEYPGVLEMDLLLEMEWIYGIDIELPCPCDPADLTMMLEVDDQLHGEVVTTCYVSKLGLAPELALSFVGTHSAGVLEGEVLWEETSVATFTGSLASDETMEHSFAWSQEEEMGGSDSVWNFEGAFSGSLSE